jgi:hypothetical protein
MFVRLLGSVNAARFISAPKYGALFENTCMIEKGRYRKYATKRNEKKMERECKERGIQGTGQKNWKENQHEGNIKRNRERK